MGTDLSRLVVFLTSLFLFARLCCDRPGCAHAPCERALMLRFPTSACKTGGHYWARQGSLLEMDFFPQIPPCDLLKNSWCCVLQKNDVGNSFLILSRHCPTLLRHDDICYGTLLEERPAGPPVYLKTVFLCHLMDNHLDQALWSFKIPTTIFLEVTSTFL